MKSSLVIEKADRKDTAVFSCTATNEFGEDSLSVQVTVKGKIYENPTHIPYFPVYNPQRRIVRKAFFSSKKIKSVA